MSLIALDFGRFLKNELSLADRVTNFMDNNTTKIRQIEYTNTESNNYISQILREAEQACQK